MVAFSDLGYMARDATHRMQQTRVGNKVADMPCMQTSTAWSKTGIGASVHILLHECEGTTGHIAQPKALKNPVTVPKLPITALTL